MKFSREIVSSECGYDTRLALDQIAYLLQDYVTLSLGKIGCDNISLRNKYSLMWVFTKNRIRVFSRPVWGDKIIIECDFTNTTKAITYCLTRIYDEKNNLLIEGLVECCLLDINSFRIKRISDIPFVSEKIIEDININIEEKDIDQIDEFKVSPILCDMSNHFNNAKSIEKIFSYFSLDELNLIQSNPFEITIRYYKQALMNSKLKTGLLIEDSNVYFNYKDENSNLIQVGNIRRI